MGNTHAIATRIRFGSDEAQAFNLVSRPWSSHYAIGMVWQRYIRWVGDKSRDKSLSVEMEEGAMKCRTRWRAWSCPFVARMCGCGDDNLLWRERECVVGLGNSRLTCDRRHFKETTMFRPQMVQFLQMGAERRGG